MKTEYKLIGLEKVHNLPDEKRVVATLENKHISTFKVPVGMNWEKAKELFNYCKNDWGSPKIAIVEHSGIKWSYPQNAIVINIKHA